MGRIWEFNYTPYEIETEIYSGPLDLLLDLIQKAELDISKLSLAQVTEQFLDFIAEHRTSNPEGLSEFLVIASKLIQIKSESLLPRPPVRPDDEEDPGEALAIQLKLYKGIKNTALWLNSRIEANIRSYLHIGKEYPQSVQFDLTGIDLLDLLASLDNLGAVYHQITYDSVFNIPTITLRKKIQDILQVLKTDQKTNFADLIGKEKTRLNTIVVFLAILELVKQDIVSTEQTNIFSDIQICVKEDLSLSFEENFVIEE